MSLRRFRCIFKYYFFFFNDTATTEIYTLSLHDALPISGLPHFRVHADRSESGNGVYFVEIDFAGGPLKEEIDAGHAAELQGAESFYSVFLNRFDLLALEHRGDEDLRNLFQGFCRVIVEL